MRFIFLISIILIARNIKCQNEKLVNITQIQEELVDITQIQKEEEQTNHTSQLVEVVELNVDENYINNNFLIQTNKNQKKVISNGFTEFKYNTNFLDSLQIIQGVEQYSRYKIHYDTEYIRIYEHFQEIKNKSVLSVNVTISNEQMNIQYICKKQGSSLIKYKFVLTSHKENIWVYREFGVIKRCGDIGLYSFKMGLKKFSMTKQSSQEIVINGQMQTSFIDSRLQNIPHDNLYDLYFWSYNCDYQKYARIFNKQKQAIQKQSQYRFIQELRVSNWYFMVEDIRIVQPVLRINDMELELDYYSYLMEDIDLEQSSSSIHKPTSFIEEDEYMDNIEEASTVRKLKKQDDDQRIKKKFESIDEYQWQQFTSSKSMLKVQNSALKRLIDLLNSFIIQAEQDKLDNNSQQELFQEMLEGEDWLDQLLDQNSSGQQPPFVSPQQFLALLRKMNQLTSKLNKLKKQYAINKVNLEKYEQQRQLIGLILDEASEEPRINNITKSLIKQLNAIKNFKEVSQEIDLEEQQEIDEMSIIESNTDISNLNSDEQPIYSLKSNVDQIKIEYNCKLTGESKFKLVILPQQPLSPLRPITIEFHKKCKAIPIPYHVTLGLYPFDTAIFNNITKPLFHPQNPTYYLNNTSTFTIYISLKKTNIFIQRLQFPLISYNATTEMTISYSVANYIKKVQIQDQASLMVLTQERPIPYTFMLDCHYLGLGQVKVSLTLNKKYTDINFSFYVLCGVPKLHLHVYSYKPQINWLLLNHSSSDTIPYHSTNNSIRYIPTLLHSSLLHSSLLHSSPIPLLDINTTNTTNSTNSTNSTTGRRRNRVYQLIDFPQGDIINDDHLNPYYNTLIIGQPSMSLYFFSANLASPTQFLIYLSIISSKPSTLVATPVPSQAIYTPSTLLQTQLILTCSDNGYVSLSISLTVSGHTHVHYIQHVYCYHPTHHIYYLILIFNLLLLALLVYHSLNFVSTQFGLFSQQVTLINQYPNLNQDSLVSDYQPIGRPSRKAMLLLAKHKRDRRR